MREGDTIKKILEHQIEQAKHIVSNKTKQEFEREKADLSILNDTIFENVLSNPKNNPIIRDIANALKQIDNLKPIKHIERTVVQKSTLYSPFLLGRVIDAKRMVADSLSYGPNIVISTESQLGAQRDYGIRSLITMANVMREGLKRGDKYADAKDVIGINFLGFGLKELAYNENFVTRIVYSDYHNKVGFLTDKYSNYYVELPKLPKNKKGLPENYHDIWDITKALKTKFKDYEEVKGMQELRNSTALAILDELHNALSSDDVVYEALLRKEAQSLYEEQLYEEKIKGIEQGITETVVEMLREGFERDVIAKITKMPMDRVDEIASEYGV